MSLKKSSLLVLNPFLDSKRLIHANGRLTNSSLSYNERHPIIITEKSSTLHLTFLHHLTMHGEHRLMQQMFRQEFYIPRLRPVMKKSIFMCNLALRTNRKCTRRSLQLFHQNATIWLYPLLLLGLILMDLFR